MTPDTTVNTPPGAVAGTAPREMKLETGKMSLEGHSVSAALAGAGGVTVNADALHGDRRAITTITQNLATNTFEIRDAVRALVQATQAQIKQLEEKRLNDPETAELIEFLKDRWQLNYQIVENIERAIAQPGSEPDVFRMAGTIAYDLKNLAYWRQLKKIASKFGRAALLWAQPAYWLSGSQVKLRLNAAHSVGEK